MELLVLLGFAALLPLAIFIGWYQRQAYEEMLASVAGQLGLVVVPGGLFARAGLQGNMGTISVKVSTETTGSGKHRKVNTLVHMSDTMALNQGSLAAEGIASSMVKLVGVNDFVLGDPHFDQRVKLHTTDPADTVARLGQDSRPRVIAAVMAGWGMSSGRWAWRANGVVGSAADLVAQIKVAAAAIEALRLPQGREATLWQIALEDPHPVVRYNALKERIRFLPKPTVDDLQVIALRGGGEAMVAASAMGAQGYPMLDRMLGDPNWGIEAALRLARGGRWSNTAEDVCMYGLSGPHTELAIEALAVAGSVAAVGPLRELTGMLSTHRASAKDAIDAIQRRANGDAGDLAFADLAGGELSIADGKPLRK